MVSKPYKENKKRLDVTVCHTNTADGYDRISRAITLLLQEGESSEDTAKLKKLLEQEKKNEN